MKKLLLLLSLSFLLILPACAEGYASPEDCLRAAWPGAENITLAQWGDTAAAVFAREGVNVLCVMERQDDRWQMTVSNPKALLQDRGLPELLLDSDNALYWRYPGWRILTFSAFNHGSGWENVTQTTHYGAGDGETVEHIVCWIDGQLGHTSTVYDKNDMPISGGGMETVCAPFLADCIRLADFDAGRFPVLEDYEWEGEWPDRSFIREAAAYFMPEYTFVSGSLADGNLQFMMRRKDGRLVFVGCDDTGALCESTPLPEGTYYGVENFTTSLGIGPNSPLVVTVRRTESENRWGVRWIMGPEGELSIGAKCIFSSDYGQSVMYYGEHNWVDIRTIDWSTLPRSPEEAAKYLDSDGWAIVDNPDPADRLHLRVKADKGSRSLGKYYNGTPVEVIRVKGDWVQVRIGLSEGWMMKKYLDMTPDEMISLNAMPRMFPKHEPLELYSEPYLDCEARLVSDTWDMYVIGILEDEWYHVWFPLTGDDGWVLQDALTPGNG